MVGQRCHNNEKLGNDYAWCEGSDKANEREEVCGSMKQWKRDEESSKEEKVKKLVPPSHSGRYFWCYGYLIYFKKYGFCWKNCMGPFVSKNTYERIFLI